MRRANMARRKQPEHENHERWLVSYADFITLLFAFFVVMFASSQADKGKVQQISQAVRNAFEGKHAAAVAAAVLGGSPDTKGQGNAQMKGPGGAMEDLLPSLEVLSEELAEEIKAGEIQISMESRGLVVSFAQAALFPSGEDVVSVESYSGLAKVAAAIARVPNPVRLEGHTDSIPIHTARFQSNWDLSAARSIALLKILSERFQVPVNRLSVAGYAETAPVASNADEPGRSRNRRVDIVILNQQGMQGEPLKVDQ